MFCARTSTCNDVGSVPVYLNVYDLTPINGYAYWLGLGVYHSGVQASTSFDLCKREIACNAVHGVEYAFGAHENSSTGIFEGEPKHGDGFTFRESILIGKTDMSPTEVRAVMETLAVEYRGNAYNLITKNCNHFCNDVCLRLTGNPIPSWVNRLARLGFLCHCVLPATLNSTKVRGRVIEDKGNEGEKKNLSDDSKTYTTSTSSSSPAGKQVRGRSRTRRAIPPSSPLVLHSSSP